MQPKDKPWIRFLWALHKWVYGLSGGRIGSRLVGMPVLQLFSIGRKTGAEHDHLLTYVPHGDAYLIAASNGGADAPPGWYFNLKAHPDTRIGVRGRLVEVRARETRGAERDELWGMFKTALDNYRRYEGRTERVIPVMALEPRGKS